MHLADDNALCNFEICAKSSAPALQAIWFISTYLQNCKIDLHDCNNYRDNIRISYKHNCSQLYVHNRRLHFADTKKLHTWFMGLLQREMH